MVRELLLRATCALLLWLTWLAAAVRKPTLLFVISLFDSDLTAPDWKGNGCAKLSYGSCYSSTNVDTVVHVYLDNIEISAISKEQVIEKKTAEFDFTDGQVLKILEKRNVFTFQAFEDC